MSFVNRTYTRAPIQHLDTLPIENLTDAFQTLYGTTEDT